MSDSPLYSDDDEIAPQRPQEFGSDLPTDEQAAKLERCQKRIGYRFKDQSLLLEALTHASGAPHRLASNERLEFLGDSILGLVVCEWLYEEYPEYSEGDLTKIKSAVVSRRSCGQIARLMGLEECLIVGKGVVRNRNFPRSLVSDVFESIVAAIYLDSDFFQIRELLREWLADELRETVTDRGSGNYKSIFQQYAQKELSDTPCYRLVSEAGPDHSKTFRVAARVGDRQFTAAWGRNKKEAEQHAAANALAELHHQPLPFEDRTESQERSESRERAESQEVRAESGE